MGAPLSAGTVHSRMIDVLPPDLAVRTGTPGAVSAMVANVDYGPRTHALAVDGADDVVVGYAGRKAGVFVLFVGLLRWPRGWPLRPTWSRPIPGFRSR